MILAAIAAAVLAGTPFAGLVPDGFFGTPYRPIKCAEGQTCVQSCVFPKRDSITAEPNNEESFRPEGSTRHFRCTITVPRLGTLLGASCLPAAQRLMLINEARDDFDGASESFRQGVFELHNAPPYIARDIFEDHLEIGNRLVKEGEAELAAAHALRACRP